MVDLRRMRYLMQRLPMARLNVERAMSRATKVTSTLSDMPHGSGVSNPVADGVERLTEAKAALQRLQGELHEMQAQLMPVIDELDNPLERTVMQMRYMDGISAWDIAYGLNYSERQIFRILKKAESRTTEKMSVMSVTNVI